LFLLALCPSSAHLRPLLPEWGPWCIASESYCPSSFFYKVFLVAEALVAWPVWGDNDEWNNSALETFEHGVCVSFAYLIVITVCCMLYQLMIHRQTLKTSSSAGSTWLTWRRFAMYNVLGALVWAVLFVGGGFFFGNLPFVQVWVLNAVHSGWPQSSSFSI
jgi:hypothetical protein